MVFLNRERNDVLTTRKKLVIARFASLGIRNFRRIFGRGSEAQVRRAGVEWDLDLREGIDLAIYLNQYQQIPKRFLEPITGRDCTVIDIGANIGTFALPLAHSLGANSQLVAIEATDFAFGKLKRNIDLNRGLSDRIIPVQAILGDGEKPSEAIRRGIYASWRVDRRLEKGSHPLHGGSRMSVAGAVHSTLDNLVHTDPRLATLPKPIAAVKIDVDGHECAVLRGARQTLRANRPILLIEIAPYVQNEVEGGFEALLSELSAQDYRLHDPGTGRRFPQSADELERIIPHGAGADLLGVPTAGTAWNAQKRGQIDADEI